MILNGEYRIIITKAAQRDKERGREIPTLKKRVDELLSILRVNPFQNPPPYEKLVGNLKGMYSRRLNQQHRFIALIHPNVLSKLFRCGRTMKE